MYTEYSVGRAESCDITISDRTVSKLHAELVVSRSGRFFLTDCGSSSGTYVRNATGNWELVTQAYVGGSQDVLLGDFLCNVLSLLDLLELPKDTPEPEEISETIKGNDLPEGQVRRDPVTGEIKSIEG